MPLVRLLVITDCCLLAACLVMIGILVLLEWCVPNQRQGRHRHESTGLHRVGGSVASIRQRERADELRYYPKSDG